MNYYKRFWDETTGDDLTDSWGTSTFYFETDEENNVLRQVQVFQNEKGLKYGDEFSQDEYGFLSDQPLDDEEFKSLRIEKDEFENFWKMTRRP